KHRWSAVRLKKKSVAVLPLQNLNADPSVDYLGFALADEIANVLTNSRVLDVRPSAITRRYNGADLDLQKIGRELKVGNVLTGHFVRQEKQLLVTLEAVEVTSERVLWQTTLTAAANELISFQAQLDTQVRQGLLPLLGAERGYI